MQTQTIGDRIRKLRTLKGWSQQELANRLGVSRVAVNKYEQNVTDPTKRIKDIAELLDTSVAYLMTGDDGRKTYFDPESSDSIQLTFEDKQIIAKLRSLDERGRITVLDLLDRELLLLRAYGK